MLIKRNFGAKIFAADGTVVSESARKVNRLDVASDISDGLVFVVGAQRADDRVRRPPRKPVKIRETRELVLT